MSTFFEYIIKLSLCYAVIYLFYFTFLRGLTHYRMNRFFLLTASLLAFFIPLLRADSFVAPQTITASSFINSIPAINKITTGTIFIPGESSLNIVSMLLWLFIAGVIICMIHFFIQFLSFKKIRRSAELISKSEGISLYHLEMDIIPFTFGDSIYINKTKHAAGELKEIIRHESVHVYQKHIVDVLIAEFICMLNWYNPFAWLIKLAIKQNLEFLADDTVLVSGTDKKTYQYLLLKVMGNAPLTISSNLNFSSLKKRIYMMNKTKTSKTHLLKFLFVLPMIALLMLAFRDTNATIPGTGGNNNVNTNDETYKLSQLTYSIPDPQVAAIVKKEQSKSLLQVGKPFTITLIKNERDRLRSLLEKNGYNNINGHAISFLIDSTLSNNNFSVQINIDLQTKAVSINKNSNDHQKANAITSDENKYHPVTSWNNGFAKAVGLNISEQQTIPNNLNTVNISII